MSYKGIIRKITLGDTKTGMTYKKGQNMFNNTIKVIEILHNDDFRGNTGKSRYDSFVKISNILSQIIHFIYYLEIYICKIRPKMTEM